MQAVLWWGCGIAVAIAMLAAVADHRRARRSNLEAVGFMPWPLILVVSLLSAAVFAAIALKTG